MEEDELSAEEIASLDRLEAILDRFLARSSLPLWPLKIHSNSAPGFTIPATENVQLSSDRQEQVLSDSSMAEIMDMPTDTLDRRPEPPSDTEISPEPFPPLPPPPMTMDRDSKEDDMSEEDIALKLQLELLVEHVQDVDPGVQKLALESMRQEIRTSTSSMISVPKSLKFLPSACRHIVSSSRDRRSAPMTTLTDDGDKTCPLCAEEMDLTDQQLKPCKYGYEICVWYWHHIMEMTEKEYSTEWCPACRTPYDKDKIVRMAANCEKAVVETGIEKIQTSPRGRLKTTSDARKHLNGVWVIKRNLAYIIGLPSTLADENILESKELFGQYGKVLKVSISRMASTTATSQQAASSITFSVYITYAREADAIRCIQVVKAVNTVSVIQEFKAGASDDSEEEGADIIWSDQIQLLQWCPLGLQMIESQMDTSAYANDQFKVFDRGWLLCISQGLARCSPLRLSKIFGLDIQQIQHLEDKVLPLGKVLIRIKYRRPFCYNSVTLSFVRIGDSVTFRL